jgi:hypothetical protein
LILGKKLKLTKNKKKYGQVPNLKMKKKKEKRSISEVVCFTGKKKRRAMEKKRGS